MGLAVIFFDETNPEIFASNSMRVDDCEIDFHGIHAYPFVTKLGMVSIYITHLTWSSVVGCLWQTPSVVWKLFLTLVG